MRKTGARRVADRARERPGHRRREPAIPTRLCDVNPSLSLLFLFAWQDPPPIEAPAPTAANHAKWMAFVEPDATETAYRAVPWRTQFWPAVQEARALGRPVLFWAMNGHPLGCT